MNIDRELYEGIPVYLDSGVQHWSLKIMERARAANFAVATVLIKRRSQLSGRYYWLRVWAAFENGRFTKFARANRRGAVSWCGFGSGEQIVEEPQIAGRFTGHSNTATCEERS